MKDERWRSKAKLLRRMRYGYGRLNAKRAKNSKGNLHSRAEGSGEMKDGKTDEVSDEVAWRKRG